MFLQGPAGSAVRLLRSSSGGWRAAARDIGYQCVSKLVSVELAGTGKLAILDRDELDNSVDPVGSVLAQTCSVHRADLVLAECWRTGTAG
jgi:hypothetical protein